MNSHLLTDEQERNFRFPLEAGPQGWRAVERILQVQFNPDVVSLPGVAGTALEWLKSMAPPAVDIAWELLRNHGATVREAAFDLAADWLGVALTPIERLQRASIMDAYFPEGVDLLKVARALNELPFVQSAVPVPLDLPPMGTPGSIQVSNEEDGIDQQWYLKRCRADRAWVLATGEGVVIADIDFGFRTSHDDLTNIEAAGAFNSADGSNNVGHGSHIRHGTAVLGLAAGARNATGMLGIAFNSRLWPIQANSGAGPRIPGQKWARAIEHVRVADSGGRPKVVILEVQTGRGRSYEMVPAVNLAIRQAISHGVIVVVAAGNGHSDVSRDDNENIIPETGAILVGATVFHATENPRAEFSNFGERITVSAPGDPGSDLTCDGRGDDLYRPGFGGTSGAAPKVAAACALMLERNPSLAHDEVKEILVETGTSVTTTPDKPAGVFLDIEAAVRQAR